MTRNLAIVRTVRELQKNFLADRKVPSLLSGKVLLDQFAIGASKVVEGVSDVLTDVDLSIGIGDLVNNLQESLPAFLNYDPHNLSALTTYL